MPRWIERHPPKSCREALDAAISASGCGAWALLAVFGAVGLGILNECLAYPLLGQAILAGATAVVLCVGCKHRHD